MQPAITVENISKKYQFGKFQPYHTLRDTLMGMLNVPVSVLQGRNIKLGRVKDEFWALKDVSFQVNRGEILGVIGANGAGKSTLLKILSRITPPTLGKATLRGRVGSLLEVGTGFHQELTGRENIYLSGAILGMKNIEIRSKFDEIVDFSGIGKFLDTPIKYYSSGMSTRLGFSVAAFLEPEILLIDEVLSVGDAEFQKKSLGKMEDITRNEGRTIVFISHNLSSVQKMCDKTLLLSAGKKTLLGETPKVVSYYMETISKLKRPLTFQKL